MYAVVGLDCLLPGALSAQAWLELREPQIFEVPSGRWPGCEPPLSTRRGGFVQGFSFDPEGLEPVVPWEALDPLFAWVAHVARGALPATARRERTGLVLASLGLPSSGQVRAFAGRRLTREQRDAVGWLEGGHPLDLAQFLGPARAAAAALGLSGPVETLDAACASGLYAVRQALDLLEAGEVDCAVAAAVNRSDSSYLFHGFTALKALSPSGTPRPLDARADGLVVGEGAVAVALKRLPDALRDGDAIHAVIRAVGTGSDGRKGNLLAPAEEGQLRALRSAWRQAGLDPLGVGLIECHATGTPLGDGVELRALHALLEGRQGPPAVVHSAKALVGHTVTAAGLAGLLRAIGAVRDGVLPASASCETPRPELNGSRLLRVLDRPEPWEGDGPRRAAVSAFGFGGTNAHLVLEAFAPGDPGLLPPRQGPALAIVGLSVQVGDLRDADWADAVKAGQSAPAWSSGVQVAPGRFKIPPLELEEMLPQQRLALDLAATLLERERPDRARTASVVGIEIDPAIGAVVLRWALQQAGRAQEAQALAPALSASRVQGALPNFVANRIAAQLDLRGPSYVTAGGLAALHQAGRLLRDPELSAVVVGAVDLSGPLAGLAGDAGVMLLVRRLEDVRAEGGPLLAELRLSSPAPASAPAPPSGLGAAQALVALAQALVLGEELALDGLTVLPRARPFPDTRAFAGTFGADTVPLPLPLRPGEPVEALPVLTVEPLGERPLPWRLAPLPLAPRPSPVAALALSQRGPWRFPRSSVSNEALAQALARSMVATAAAHDRFLDAQSRALEPLVALGEALSRASLPRPLLARPLPPPAVAPEPLRPIPADEPPRSFDRAALLRHAGPEPLSAIFGERYRDLDGVEPRVRMPLPPLLLCDRVVALEGERGRFGPARIVTEYDVPVADWTADGRPPAFVVVESGQADLFLVSFLGIDAECRGERVYRLLDCDLEFLAPRPAPGTTLRHDIRIERFARLGGTTLFYFHYDCIDRGTGTAVLRMRGGCAGFFTPAELSRPRGLQVEPRKQAPCEPLPPVLQGAPGALSEAQLEALAAGRFSEAMGPSFAAAEGSRLTLPPQARWRLVHRVLSLSTSGGPHGLGEVLAEQDLSDDDWFNPVHFHGDPCMPGTLMLEGCLQAVQIWLLAHGFSASHPDGAFEVVPGRPIRLRCRGQVAPGHRKLRYHARIVEAGLEPHPYAIADVVLSVDGVEVVHAQDVGVRIEGERVAVRAAPRSPVLDWPKVLEFSIGSAVRAFGPWYAPFEGPGRRCPRMPGPPLLQMTEVLSVEGPPQQPAPDKTATIAYDLPRDAWFWRADALSSLPWVILLETALQPCGWLTAWQAQGLQGGDLYFRNLGGVGVQHRPVPRDAGRLLTTARQVELATIGTLRIQRFTVEMRSERDGALIFSGETQFGYFTRAALEGQKGLAPLFTMDLPPMARALDGHPALPRSDLRMLDVLVGADERAGAAGLGQYAAIKRVDPDDWYFVAHFWLDPVMPGSLGLEALVQLARLVFCERIGYSGDLEILPLGEQVRWTYRGQIRRHNREMRVELEVLSIDEAGLRARGQIRADGLTIYLFEDFGVRVPSPRAVAPPAPARPQRQPVRALLDTFEVRADQGVGTLSLDPAQHPWLDAHRPTLTVAAVPMAFAAEIAAEAAASLLRPGERVVGLPLVQVERWMTERDGVLQIAAVRQGEHVAVTLGVGGEPRARAIVALGPQWSEVTPLLRVEGERLDWEGPAFFASGRTFHGPLLQAMTALSVLGPQGAQAWLQTRPDPELLGLSGHTFVLDPLLLDAATHPMLSGEPERWKPLAPGKLAYPVRMEDLRLFGPRPAGPVEVRLALLPSDPRSLRFEVQLVAPDGLWCAYRWQEVLVPGGPVLGQPAEVRRRFLWEQKGDPQVRIGRPIDDGQGWQVRAGDLVEPLPGTLLALYGASDVRALAVKELVRHRAHPELHPRDIELLEIRPDHFVVTAVPSMPADTYVALLHPTRFAAKVVRQGPVCEVQTALLP